MSILKTTLGGISSLTVECVGDEARFRWRSFPIRCVVQANEFRGTVHFRNDALGGFASVPSKVWFSSIALMRNSIALLCTPII